MKHEDIDKSDVVNTPAIGITLNNQLDDFRTIVLQSFVAATAPEAELNAMLDKLRRASERQKAAAHLPTHEGILADKRAALEGETRKLFELEMTMQETQKRWDASHEQSGRRGPFKLSPSQTQEKTRLEQEHAKAVQNLTVLQKEIPVYERQVADMKARLAEGG